MLWQQTRCRRQNKFINKKGRRGIYFPSQLFPNSQMLKSLHNKMRVLL